MTYNRCIGTTLLSNQTVPYSKVRRLQLFQLQRNIGVLVTLSTPYTPARSKSANRKLASIVLNPEGTVRGRVDVSGKKCTYCVQRIEKAKINAAQTRWSSDPRCGKSSRRCVQAACPTGAIEFGKHPPEPDHAVAKAKKDFASTHVEFRLNVKSPEHVPVADSQHAVAN